MSAISGGIILVALLIGTCGYKMVEGMAWVDALLNASMILAGMGPVTELKTTGGKLFASAYALFSGIVFFSAAAFLAAPWLHRFLRRFHLDMDEERDQRP